LKEKSAMEVKHLNLRVSEKSKEAQILTSKGFRKIGHIKDDCIGFCVNLEAKTFFELSEFRNPNIPIVDQLPTGA